MYIDPKKVVIKTNDGSITRLANRYRDLNVKLKQVKEGRDESLDKLRDTVLNLFDPMDADKTRVLSTNSLRITVNKDTVRKTIKTDMEAVFENICEIYNIPREDLDKIIELNSEEVEVNVKPAVKVEG